MGVWVGDFHVHKMLPDVWMGLRRFKTANTALEGVAQFEHHAIHRKVVGLIPSLDEIWETTN